MELLDLDAARAAVWGGLVLGAGGGGLEEGLASAEAVLRLGRPRLASLEELDARAGLVISTSVGAPGADRGLVQPSHRVRAMASLRSSLPPGEPPVVGTMSSHPGAWIAETWVHAALDSRLVVADAAANGRGHPTVEMGGLGLAGRADVLVTQAAVGGATTGPTLEVVASGPTNQVASVVRAAAVEVGGLIAACRGVYSVGFCREAAAGGAVSLSIAVGRSVLDALGRGPDAMVEALGRALGATVLAEGRVRRHTTDQRGGFDVGTLVVEGPGAPTEVAICNEFLTAERAGERLASFPDLVVVLDGDDGRPVPARGSEPGTPVVVLAAGRERIPLGAGVRDRSVYRQVEDMVGRPLADYAFR